MFLQSSDILFPYSNDQGNWLVQYSVGGYAYLFALVAPKALAGFEDISPAEGRERFQQATGTYHALSSWPHQRNIGKDRQKLDTPGLREEYRNLFEHDQIARTVLETASQSRLERQLFTVTTGRGKKLNAVLREDGSGYVLRHVVWDSETEAETRKKSKTTNHQAFFPVPFSHVPEDARKFADDIRDMSMQSDEVRQRMLEDYFWNIVNPQLRRRWIKDQTEITTQPVVLDNGSLDELRHLFSCVGQLDEEFDFGSGKKLALSFRCAGGEAEFQVYNDKNNWMVSSSTRAILLALLNWAKPRGCYVRFIGGDEDLLTSYSRVVDVKVVKVVPPSATERLEALEHLIDWSEKVGIDIQDYLPN